MLRLGPLAAGQCTGGEHYLFHQADLVSTTAMLLSTSGTLDTLLSLHTPQCANP
jgi:hypothetical protein